MPLERTNFSEREQNVVKSQEQLMQAFDELQRGTFLKRVSSQVRRPNG